MAHSVKLFRLKKRKVSFCKNILTKEGTVEILSTLYMRLRFQKLMRLIRKYEATQLFRTK